MVNMDAGRPSQTRKLASALCCVSLTSFSARNDLMRHKAGGMTECLFLNVKN